VKAGEDVLVKSAEFIGWALGGLEREIALTRDRLTALTAEAVKLRARIGTPSPAPAAAKTRPARPASRPARRLPAGKRQRIPAATRARTAGGRKKKG
jgi:hypothetical protein